MKYLVTILFILLISCAPVVECSVQMVKLVKVIEREKVIEGEWRTVYICYWQTENGQNLSTEQEVKPEEGTVLTAFIMR